MSEENAPQKERYLREVEQKLLRKELLPDPETGARRGKRRKPADTLKVKTNEKSDK